jgi:hypothetical protein
VANLARKLSRKGTIGIISKAGGLVIERKSVDGWWTRKRAELASRKPPTGPGESPLERRISRGIKKATER